jgi:hypothetical protein
MAVVYHIKDKRADRDRRERVTADDDATLAERSSSMLSYEQRNRVAREYRIAGATPAANYCIAIELQDYANRFQEHWRAAQDALQPPTR